MKSHYYSFQDIPQFSQRDKAYQAKHPDLQEFLQFEFEESELSKIIDTRKKFPVDRSLLVKELQNQYSELELGHKTKENIEALLNEDTFTLTTAHQPSLLTGPFYYILKIASTIHLSKKWSEKTGKSIVPVFIIGGEDHDFDEINHLSLFNKMIDWNREAGGPVGRMSTEGLPEIIEEVGQILGDRENAMDLKSIMNRAIRNSKTYGEFMFRFTHLIFDRYGLVIIQFDNSNFKTAFQHLIRKEIFEQFSQKLVEETQFKLEQKGFNSQAHVREINFFYLTPNKRSRIVLENNYFHVLDTDFRFNMEELEQEIVSHPERFSPNVIMRPLFQETILPNLAYIGGGGELAYWTERKSQFNEAEVFFPLLIRRNSVCWLNKRNQKLLSELGLNFEDLLKDTDLLLKEYALSETEHDIEVEEEMDLIQKAFEKLSLKAGEIDSTLVPKIEAMKANQINGIEKLQQRLVRTIKQNQEVKLNKIRKLKESLFPGNGLQERTSNFMEFYIEHGELMIDYLIDICDPFDKRFIVVET